jgi:hypothetical protein
MEIEITLTRVKVVPPRLFLVMDGPHLEEATEEEKKQDEALKIAVAEYNAKLEQIFGPAETVDYGKAGRWHFPTWMPDNYKLVFAESWYNFKQHMVGLTAEARALYLEGQKNLPSKSG